MCELYIWFTYMAGPKDIYATVLTQLAIMGRLYDDLYLQFYMWCQGWARNFKNVAVQKQNAISKL
jgi:hypothetical protein